MAEGSGGALVAIDAEGNLPDGGWEQLAAADAIVFGSPTYMGSVSWQFRKFADASSSARRAPATTSTTSAASPDC